MIVAPPFFPRPGEWERLTEGAPEYHNFAVVVDDQGVGTAALREDAEIMLEKHGDKAAVVERVGQAPFYRLMIWR